jgi:hypothetical protein
VELNSTYVVHVLVIEAFELNMCMALKSMYQLSTELNVCRHELSSEMNI